MDEAVEQTENAKNLQLFLDQATRLFEIEATARGELESKAVTLVGFSGLMASLMVFGFENIKTIESLPLQILAVIFALLSMGLTGAAAIIGILTIAPADFHADPNPIIFRKEYRNKEHQLTVDTLTANIADSWDKNRIINLQKAKNVELIGKLIALNIICLILFVITITYSYLCLR